MKKSLTAAFFLTLSLVACDKPSPQSTEYKPPLVPEPQPRIEYKPGNSYVLLSTFHDAQKPLPEKTRKEFQAESERALCHLNMIDQETYTFDNADQYCRSEALTLEQP